MSKVIKFPSAVESEEPDEPHLAGQAICGACGHEWEAVARVGADHLDCPNCGRLWGVFKNIVCPPQFYWRCKCGESLFWLTPTGAMCRRCGVISSEWAE